MREKEREKEQEEKEEVWMVYDTQLCVHTKPTTAGAARRCRELRGGQCGMRSKPQINTSKSVTRSRTRGTQTDKKKKKKKKWTNESGK